MKKILLATSILAATTGFAAAEVTLSGDGRLGLVYDGNDTVFSSRARVTFNLAGESDSGLSFGAKFRVDQQGDGDGTGPDGNKNMNKGTVWISGGFGTLTFGDTDSAVESLIGDVSGVGYTGFGDENELGYLAPDNTAMVYEYAVDAFSLAVGAGQLDSDARETNELLSVGVKYATDAFWVALGYTDVSATSTSLGNDEIAFGAGATFGAATLKAVVLDQDLADDTIYALSVDYTIDATTLTAFYHDNGFGQEAYGVGATYDLGGGLALEGGISETFDDAVDTRADFGVTMKF